MRGRSRHADLRPTAMRVDPAVPRGESCHAKTKSAFAHRSIRAAPAVHGFRMRAGSLRGTNMDRSRFWALVDGARKSEKRPVSSALVSALKKLPAEEIQAFGAWVRVYYA